MLVVSFVICAVHPVQNIQEPIGPQEEHIVPSKIFNLPISLQYYELRDDRKRLQVYREVPKQLRKTERISTATKEVMKTELPQEYQILRKYM